jgi:hypothetical protein
MAKGDMRPEYDFKGGVRGKHAARFSTEADLNAFIKTVQGNTESAGTAGAGFNIDTIKASLSTHNRYEHRIAQLIEKNRFVENIKQTVEEAIANLNAGSTAFVIYGEPQSGKTEMMIALTARLLDEGHRIIIVLLNDNVKLLDQNLSRFRSAGLDPSPKRHDEVLHSEISLAKGEWIIFCKKNGSDLAKLIEKLKKAKDPIVVIDDEADYATPNAKINSEDDEKTPINDLVEQVIGKDGIYIGVTATPARLNLNHTFDNETERWVLFQPHPEYKGRTVFFPTRLDNDFKSLPFSLRELPEEYDDPRFLREALFSFLVNVAHLNTEINPHETNYAMLIHTSGGKDDHKEDYTQVLKIFGILSNKDDPTFDKYIEKIAEIAAARYPGEEMAICKYVAKNARRHDEVIMNSEKKQTGSDWDRATTPQTPFTIVIGGNIVSRGVTFNNLLSMFFTRDVKHKMQQDTYIQRARMFGDRGSYLQYFELSIPGSLYKKWHRCFLFHTLALLAINADQRSPIWIEDKRIAAVAGSSIDRASVNIQVGEMSFALFKYDSTAVKEVLSDSSTIDMEKLLLLQKLLGAPALPTYLLTFMDEYRPHGSVSIAIHDPQSIEGYTDKENETDRATVRRRRGFIGTKELELGKFPGAEHHIKIFYFEENARVFYKFNEDVTFLNLK